jgi:hypothetical protein
MIQTNFYYNCILVLKEITLTVATISGRKVLVTIIQYKYMNKFEVYLMVFDKFYILTFDM